MVFREVGDVTRRSEVVRIIRKSTRYAEDTEYRGIKCILFDY